MSKMSSSVLTMAKRDSGKSDSFGLRSIRSTENKNVCNFQSAMYSFNTEDRSAVMVEHRCYGVASPGSSSQRGYKTNSCNESYPSVHIIRKSFFVCTGQSGYCSWLTTVYFCSAFPFRSTVNADSVTVIS